MKIFITGTDTDVGKTIVCSWLCLHTQYNYFKPIQTGNSEQTDSSTVHYLTKCKVYQENYSYKEPVSPHLAARLENSLIEIDKIELPNDDNIIIEGAGGLLVPINNKFFMVDVIKKLTTPVILVARSTLGTINHTLLSIEALRVRDIKILGVIMSGPKNAENKAAIELYGKVKVLACLPNFEKLNQESLQQYKLTVELQEIFKIGKL